MALSMVVTAAGPQFAPLIAGFVGLAGWRWIFWICLILAGGTLVPVAFLPETSRSAISSSPRKTGEGILVRTFTRPLYMILYEPIIMLTCLYLSYASAIFCEPNRFPLIG
jgi:MFS family permease